MTAAYQKSTKNIILLIFALLAVGLGIWAANQHAIITKNLEQPELVNSDFINPAHAIQPFTLQDSNGNTFNEQSLKDHWTFMFFGFTNCPQLCPTTLSTLAKTMQILAKKDSAINAKVLFVSVDPARDSLAKIKQYVASFDQNFEGATGNTQQIAALTKQFGILYMKTKTGQAHSSQNYNIDHSGVILLFNPQGELQALFQLPHDAVKIAQDFNVITDWLKTKA